MVRFGFGLLLVMASCAAIFSMPDAQADDEGAFAPVGEASIVAPAE